VTPVLLGLVVLALVTGTCLWIAHVWHRDGPTWTPPDRHASPSGHYLEQTPDDGYEATR